MVSSRHHKRNNYTTTTTPQATTTTMALRINNKLNFLSCTLCWTGLEPETAKILNHFNKKHQYDSKQLPLVAEEAGHLLGREVPPLTLAELKEEVRELGYLMDEQQPGLPAKPGLYCMVEGCGKVELSVQGMRIHLTGDHGLKVRQEDGIFFAREEGEEEEEEDGGGGVEEQVTGKCLAQVLVEWKNMRVTVRVPEVELHGMLGEGDGEQDEQKAEILRMMRERRLEWQDAIKQGDFQFEDSKVLPPWFTTFGFDAFLKRATRQVQQQSVQVMVQSEHLPPWLQPVSAEGPGD